MKLAWVPSVLYTLLSTPRDACAAVAATLDRPGSPPAPAPRLPAVCRDAVRVPA